MLKLDLKSTVFGFLIASIVFSGVGLAATQVITPQYTGIKIEVDGVDKTPTQSDLKPFIAKETGRAMVAVRSLGDMLNRNVVYDTKTNTIKINQKGGTTMTPVVISKNKQQYAETQYNGCDAIVVDDKTFVALKPFYAKYRVEKNIAITFDDKTKILTFNTNTSPRVAIKTVDLKNKDDVILYKMDSYIRTDIMDEIFSIS